MSYSGYKSLDNCADTSPNLKAAKKKEPSKDEGSNDIITLAYSV